LLNYALVNWIEVRAVQQPQIWEFVGGDHDYCTFGVEAMNDA